MNHEIHCTSRTYYIKYNKEIIINKFDEIQHSFPFPLFVLLHFTNEPSEVGIRLIFQIAGERHLEAVLTDITVRTMGPLVSHTWSLWRLWRQ